MASSKARWGYAAKPANKGFHARLLPTVSCPVKVSLTADLGTKYRTRRGTTAAMKAPPTIIRKPKGGTACGVKANGKIMIKAPSARASRNLRKPIDFKLVLNPDQDPLYWHQQTLFWHLVGLAVPVPIARRLPEAGLDGAHLLLIDEKAVGSGLDLILGRHKSQLKDFGVHVLELTLGTLRDVSFGYRLYTQSVNTHLEKLQATDAVSDDNVEDEMEEKPTTKQGIHGNKAIGRDQACSIRSPTRIRVTTRSNLGKG